MEIKLKIQKTKSIHFPKNLKDTFKINKFNKIKWIIHKNKNKIQIEFIQTNNNHEDKETSEKIILYRNIYSSSSIIIPKIVFQKLNCKIYDYIILTIIEEEILVKTSEKIRINELSGIINMNEGD